jgi:hypothetical protein
LGIIEEKLRGRSRKENEGDKCHVILVKTQEKLAKTLQLLNILEMALIEAGFQRCQEASETIILLLTMLEKSVIGGLLRKQALTMLIPSFWSTIK